MSSVTSSPVPQITEADMRLLRIFRAVAEAGGLTAAEVNLGMERSTISRHLLALETRLGGRLCFRGPSGFELTELIEWGPSAEQIAAVPEWEVEVERPPFLLVAARTR